MTIQRNWEQMGTQDEETHAIKRKNQKKKQKKTQYVSATGIRTQPDTT